MLLLFALTLFLSATLLFVVELMIGRMVLPMLGGTPAVWNTCMLFFQALLLAGYGYAHVTTAWLGARRQAVLHMAVLLLPFLTFGLTVDRGLFSSGEGNPILQLLLALLLSVGLPFFVVSTSASLLQKWFAGTDHPQANDPYFLYAASNLGSMVGLLGYPFILEMTLQWGLPMQRRFWQVGYGMLVLLTVGCAACLWLSGSRKEIPLLREEDEASTIADPRPPTAARKLRWVALAFVPSSLMLGATTYITTDIAAIPVLWVLPLALYLLSFILVFSRLPAGVHRGMVAVFPFLVLLLVFLMLSEFPLRISWKIMVHLAVLFVASMVCHGELARDRPATRYLTQFYLLMSVGGVLGGVFNALVAPVSFLGIAEYPLVLVLACLLMPRLEAEKKSQPGLVAGVGAMGFYLGVGVALIILAMGRSDLNFHGLAGRNGLWLLAALVGTGIVAFAFVRAAPEERQARWLDLGLPLALGVMALGLDLGLRITYVHHGLDLMFLRLVEAVAGRVPERLAQFLNPESAGPLILFIFILPVVLCSFFIGRPLRFGLGIGALLLAHSLNGLLDADVILRDRSFFGALHVEDANGYRRLYHGTTLHGMQHRQQKDRAAIAVSAASPLAAADPFSATALAAAGSEVWAPGREALTYFHRTGPIGKIFAAYHDHFAGRHLGLIGLGTGTLATYGQPEQKLTYYEIDPLIKRIAYDDGAYFSFVKDARDRGVQMDLVMGDARLKLEERAERLKQEERAQKGAPATDRFALLVVDAFSSDAIPVHLLTLQALKTYLDNLADDGLLVFHISNRYVDLEPVLGNLARALGLVGFIETDWEGDIPGKASSNWVVMARREYASVLDQLVHEGCWEEWQKESHWAESEAAMLTLSAFPDQGGFVRAAGAIGYSLLETEQEPEKRLLKAPWRRLKEDPKVGVWTDDYSNLFSVFYWKN